MARNGAFSQFVTEFGGQEEAAEEAAEKDEDDVKAVEGADPAEVKETKKVVAATALMQTEERATGAVKGVVYRDYFS